MLDPRLTVLLDRMADNNISQESANAFLNFFNEEEMTLEGLASLDVTVLKKMGMKLGPASTVLVMAKTMLKREAGIGSRRKIGSKGAETKWNDDESVWFTPVPTIGLKASSFPSAYFDIFTLISSTAIL